MEKSTQIFTIIKYQKKTSQCICLSVILINSVYSKDKNYHPRAFLEECKYVFKRNKMLQHYNIDDFDDSNKEDSDGENSDEENYYK